jgi:hypothetical protein
MLSTPIPEALRSAAAFTLLLAALSPLTAQAAPARAPAAHSYSVLNDRGRAVTVTVAPVVAQRSHTGKPLRMRIVDGGQVLERDWRGAGVYWSLMSKRPGATKPLTAWSVSLNYD